MWISSSCKCFGLKSLSPQIRVTIWQMTNLEKTQALPSCRDFSGLCTATYYWGPEMLLSPLLANACYTHILKREKERKKEWERDCQVQDSIHPNFQMHCYGFKPTTKACFKCTVRSLVSILKTNVFLSKGNTTYFYSTNYSMRSKMCGPQHTENKDSRWEHNKNHGSGSNWQNYWGPNWYYVHLKRCPGYNFRHKGQEFPSL